MFCRECATDISYTALACPSCGAVTDNKQAKERWSTGLFATLMVLSVLIPLIGWISGGIALYRRETDHGAWLLGVSTGMVFLYTGIQ